MLLSCPVNKLGPGLTNFKMKLSISFVLLFALLAIAAALPTGKVPRKMRLKSLRAKMETGEGPCTDYLFIGGECPITVEGVKCCNTSEEGTDAEEGIDCRKMGDDGKIHPDVLAANPGSTIKITCTGPGEADLS